MLNAASLGKKIKIWYILLYICLTLKGQGFSQTLQDVFRAVVDLPNIKIF